MKTRLTQGTTTTWAATGGSSLAMLGDEEELQLHQVGGLQVQHSGRVPGDHADPPERHNPRHGGEYSSQVRPQNNILINSS